MISIKNVGFSGSTSLQRIKKEGNSNNKARKSPAKNLPSHQQHHMPYEEAKKAFKEALPHANEANKIKIQTAKQRLLNGGRDVVYNAKKKTFLNSTTGVPNSDTVRKTKKLAFNLKKAGNDQTKISDALNKYSKSLKQIKSSKTSLTGFAKATLDSFGGFIWKRMF